MPSLFSGLSTPSWESPDDFLNSSVARGEKLAGNFLEGFRRSRQEAMQAPMRAMQLQAAQTEHESQLLNLAKQKNWMDTQQQMTAGEAVLSEKVAAIAKAGKWNDPAARSEIFDTVAKYPATANSPLLKETMGWMQASDKATEAAKHQADMAEVAGDRVKVLEDRLAFEREKAAGAAKVSADAEAARVQAVADAEANGDTVKTRITPRGVTSTIEPPKADEAAFTPQEMTLPGGTKLVQVSPHKWQVTDKTGNGVVMTPAIRLQVGKELADKDPRKKEIMDSLAASATGAAPASKTKAAMGGYKIDTVYKGGLKYLGGDPNDAANWQKVQ